MIRRSLCELDARYGVACLGQGDAGAAIVGGLPTGRPRAERLRTARTALPAENRTDQAQQAWGPPTACRLGSHADASVGTDDVDAHNSPEGEQRGE